MRQRNLYLFLCVFLLASCSLSVLHNKKLEQSIHSSIKKEGKVDLKEAADFDWDIAHLFHPYTPQSQINEQIGFTYKDPSGIKSSDDIYLLVFVHDHKVVQYVELSREFGDPIHEINEPLTPSDASFEVKRVN